MGASSVSPYQILTTNTHSGHTPQTVTQPSQPSPQASHTTVATVTSPPSARSRASTPSRLMEGKGQIHILRLPAPVEPRPLPLLPLLLLPRLLCMLNQRNVILDPTQHTVQT